MPNVTVLIPVYNAAATLAQTLESLILQTYKDFEVLIVNDASSDNILEVVQFYENKIPLKLIDLKLNKGVAGALDEGVEIISSPLIARLDADDLAFPDRLEKQVNFLKANPAIDVCGSAMEFFSENANQNGLIVQRPLHDGAIKTSLLQSTTMAHPTTMIRKSFFDDVGKYDGRFDYAEDYDLWCRGALLGKCYANLPDVLTKYRIHNSQVSVQKRQIQLERDLNVKRKYISALLGGENPGYLAEFFSDALSFSNLEIASMVICDSIPRILKLESKILDKNLFAKMVSESIDRHLRHVTKLS